MLTRLLFDTRVGGWLIARFERSTGLALVPADWLDDMQVGRVPSDKEGLANRVCQPVPVDGDGESPVKLSIAELAGTGKEATHVFREC